MNMKKKKKIMCRKQQATDKASGNFKHQCALLDSLFRTPCSNLELLNLETALQPPRQVICDLNAYVGNWLSRLAIS